MYPTLSLKPKRRIHHDDERIDRYPIRDLTTEIEKHIELEHEHTQRRFEPFNVLEKQIQDEMGSREPYSDCSIPIAMEKWWYITRTSRSLSYPIHSRFPKNHDTIPEIYEIEQEEIYFDENKEAGTHETFSATECIISPNEEWFSVGMDTKGDECYQFVFRSLIGKTSPPDHVEAVDMEWMMDSKHVLYTTVDATKRPYRVWRHRMGSMADELLFEEPDQRFTVSISTSTNKKVCLIHSDSTDTSYVFSTSLEQRDGVTWLGGKDGVRCEWDQCTRYQVDYWVQLTNENAIEFSCLQRPVSSSVWKQWIPSRSVRLVSVHVFDHMVIWEERVDGNAAVRYAPWGESLLEHSHLLSHPLHSIHCSNDVLPVTSPFFRVSVSSLVEPTRHLDIYPDRIRIRKIDQIPGYNPSLYQTKRIWVPRHDSDIPVTLVYRKGEAFPCPMVLYGYGSYETCIDLEVSPSRLSLLDRGVVFAIAHVRGGGECGRSWYHQGRMDQKENTFHDFIAVATYLIQKGWTSSSSLAIRGGSAGGMLMGAVMNLAPDLFRTVVAEVPFVDVLTTMLDPNLPLSVSEREEWGNPEERAVYHQIKRYSPYDNIRSLPYPSLYVTGGIHDSRVGFWEPLKWALALRDAHPRNRVYVHMEGGGHMGPTEKHSQWKEEARILTFILTELY